MGEAFTFTCSRCSYAAEACGGTDSGLEVTLTTATCSTCAEIVDVVVGRRGAPEIDDHDGRCPCCHGDALVAWGPRVFRPELTAEELVSTDERISSTTHPKISQLTRRGVDPDWLDEQIALLERMVAEGDTLELVAKLGGMMREPKRLADSGVHQALGSTPAAAAPAAPTAPLPPADPGLAVPQPEDTGSHATLS